MNTLKCTACFAAFVLLVGCNRNSDNAGGSAAGDRAVSSGAERDSSTTPSTTAHEADNTGRNVRDRSDSTLTPGDQGGSDADREMTRRIRRAITENDQLSTDAKNIKIITTDGKVTLRGPVKNRQELEAIQSIVQQAGVKSLDNQLEVKATNQ